MNRSEINNMNMTGVRVHGIYCSQVVNGTVVDSRPCYGQDMEYTVKLDSNIFPFHNMDDPRDTLLLRGSDLEESYDISGY